MLVVCMFVDRKDQIKQKTLKKQKTTSITKMKCIINENKINMTPTNVKKKINTNNLER